MKGGDQSNESAIENAKDEQIAGVSVSCNEHWTCIDHRFQAIRSGWKQATGKDFPV